MSVHMLVTMFLILFGVSILCIVLAFVNSKSELITSIACVIAGICALTALMFIGELYDIHPLNSGNNVSCRGTDCEQRPQSPHPRSQSGPITRTPGSEGKAPPTQTKA